MMDLGEMLAREYALSAGSEVDKRQECQDFQVRKEMLQLPMY